MKESKKRTLQIDAHSPCICGSGRTVAKCHKNVRNVFIRPKGIYPTISFTGKGHPKCFFKHTENCDETISGEHILSASILRVLSKERIVIEGIDYKREVKINSDSIKTNIFCRRHNTSLGVLDVEAGRLLKSFLNIETSLESPKTSDQKAFLFSGHDIERWMLKTLIASFFGRISKANKDTHSLPNNTIKYFEEKDWEDSHGLYFKTSQDGKHAEIPLEPRVEISLVIQSQIISGINIKLMGLHFLLLINGGQKEIEAFSNGFSYRPSQLVFYTGRQVRIMGFQWENYDGDRSIEIARDVRDQTLPREGTF